MAELKNHQVDDWLKKPPASAHLVLVYGPDRGLVSERATLFAKSTGLDFEDAFAVIKLDENTEDLAGRLIDEAGTVSMFGGDRLVWLKAGTPNVALINAVSELLENPVDGTTILIEAGELRKTAKLRTLVEKSGNGVALPCYQDDARAIDRLIDTELAQAGLTIDLEARHVLKAALGGDRMASRGELSKLVLYAGDTDRITVDDVRASVGDAAGLDQDSVVDAVLSGNPESFDTAFSRMIQSGTPGFLTVAATLRQIHTAQSLRAAVDHQNKTAASAVASARPPIFFTRKALFERLISALDSGFLARAAGRLQETILRSRRYPDLGDEIIRQSMMGLALEIRSASRRR